MEIRPGQLAAWFEAYAPRLVLYARQWLGPALAEDVVQEAFLALMRQPAPPESVQGWLFAAVRNAAISAERSRRRRSERERAVAGHESWFAGSTEALDAQAAQAALSALPRIQREIVILRIWGDLTLSQIGQTVAMPVSTVHDNYRAAMSTLRRMMENPCSTPNP